MSLLFSRGIPVPCVHLWARLAAACPDRFALSAAVFAACGVLRGLPRTTSVVMNLHPICAPFGCRLRLRRRACTGFWFL
ncbi:hypothetical protein C8R47DRAFT_1106581, partial [Mycena vitilis]